MFSVSVICQHLEILTNVNCVEGKKNIFEIV